MNSRAIISNGATLTNVENTEIKINIKNLISIINPTTNVNSYKNYADFSKITLCAIFEIITRFFTDKNINNKIYFLKPIEHVYTMDNTIF
jgi:hypothetical protein